MPVDVSKLDASELLHLAIEAANRDDHATAISHLKDLQQFHRNAPQYADATYFLGAEYAQIGMYDRAVEQMSDAVAIAPHMSIARFQLGLLHLTSGRVDAARLAWSALGEIESTHPDYYLHLFKDGMEALAEDRFEDCKQLLTQGQGMNKANIPLNGDMQRVLDSLPKDAAEPPVGTSVDETPEGEQQEHLFLSAYKNKTSH